MPTQHPVGTVDKSYPDSARGSVGDTQGTRVTEGECDAANLPPL